MPYWFRITHLDPFGRCERIVPGLLCLQGKRFFKEHVLGGIDYSPTAKTVPTIMAVTSAVSKDINAIGYGGLVYGVDVIHCSINHFTPWEENVKNNRYPIIRYLYFYTIDTPRGRERTLSLTIGYIA